MNIQKKKRGRPTTQDYSKYLKLGETLDMFAADDSVLRKRRHDEKVRQTKEDQEERSSVPDCIDWACSWSTKYPEQSAELKQFIAETTKKISDELQLPADRKDNGDIDLIIDQLCRCSLSFKKKSWVWVRKTVQGYAVGGGYIPDYFGDQVPLVNYYNLKPSATFSELYIDVLRELDKRYGTLKDTSAEFIKQELAGSFKLSKDWLPWWKQPKRVKVEEHKSEVKSYRTNEDIIKEPPTPPQPRPEPQVSVYRPPSLVDYSTRDLDPAASAYLAGQKDPYPQRSHLGPYGSKDRKFLYGEG